MLKESMKLIGQEIANNGKVISFVNNSIFNVIEDTAGKTSNTKETANIEYINRLSTLLSNTVSYYKNKLLPFLLEYREEVNKITLNRLGQVVINDINIEQVSISSLVTELMDKEIVGQSSSLVELPINMLSISLPEDPMSYVKSDSPILDKYLKDLLEVNGYGEEEVIKLWEKYLLNVSSSNDAITNIRYNIPINIDELTILFMLVRNIKDNAPSTITINLSSYTKVMNEFYTKLRNDITYAVEVIKRDISKNRVIFRIKEKTVYVNRPIFNKYLKDNKVEGILGLAVSEDKDKLIKYYLDELIRETNKHLASWSKYTNLKKLSINETSIYRNAYAFALKELYTNTDEDVMEKLKYKELLKAESEILECVSTMSLAELKDINKTTIVLLLELLEEDNNFGMYINSIYNYNKTLDNLQPNQAASLATLDLLLGYLLQQVVVK